MACKHDQLLNYLFLHISICFFSFTGVVAKFASQTTFFSLKFILLYGLELGITFVYALLWQQIIKHLPISVAYANRSVVIIWSLVWAVVFFSEHITRFNLIGSIIVLTGVIIISNDV